MKTKATTILLISCMGILLVLAGLSCNSGDTGPVLVNAWLTWTASGDDGDQGCATNYQLCVSSVPLNYPINTDGKLIKEWPVVACAGAADSVEVSDLQSGETYWFTLRVKDEADNWSGWSNIISKAMLDIIGPATIEDLNFADTL